MFTTRILLGVFFVVSVTSISNAANIIYVDVNSPNEPGTGSYLDPFRRIQNAIDAANNGDTVEIREGIYTGPGNYDLDPNGKSITIQSTDPNDPNVVASTIIDPNKAGRGFYFDSGEDANCIVEGLTIQNAYSDFGAGILCQDSSPTISNCIIRDNSAVAFGGGVFCWGSDSRLVGCIFSGNSADAGGGIECWSGQPTIINCVILHNVATGTGSDAGGGGVDCYYSGNPILRNCTIAGNTALSGGGMLCVDSNVVVANCTMAGNSADLGGGLCCAASELVIKNSILWANEAQAGAQVSVPSWLGKASSVTVRYSDVQGGETAVDVGPVSTLNWGSGNIDADPNFAHLTPNGDPNMWDFHLQSTYGRWDSKGQSWVYDANISPCIDAGDPNSDWAGEPWPNGKRINMGAYGGTDQASMNGNPADFNISGVVNFADYAKFSDKWYANEFCIQDLSGDGVVDFTDLGVFAENWLWQKEK